MNLFPIGRHLEGFTKNSRICHTLCWNLFRDYGKFNYPMKETKEIKEKDR